MGYGFANGFAVEAEYTKTNFKLAGGDGDIATFAAYGVYRTQGDFYGKFKAGILSETVKASNRFSRVEATETGLSAGIGAGYRFNDTISMELEYTMIEKDVNFLSAALNFHF